MTIVDEISLDGVVVGVKKLALTADETRQYRDSESFRSDVNKAARAIGAVWITNMKGGIVAVVGASI